MMCKKKIERVIRGRREKGRKERKRAGVSVLRGSRKTVRGWGVSLRSERGHVKG